MENLIIYNINNFEFIWFVREPAQQHVVDFILGVDLSGDNTRAKTSRLSLHWSEERMIKTAVVSLLVLPHFIAYPANKYEKLARINPYRSLGRFIIQNSQQLQLQQSWSIQLTSKSMLGAQKVCEGTQCVLHCIYDNEESYQFSIILTMLISSKQNLWLTSAISELDWTSLRVESSTVV